MSDRSRPVDDEWDLKDCWDGETSTGRSMSWPRVFLVPCIAIAGASIWSVVVGWIPRNDRAFVQLKVLDVFGPSTPLIGMPSTLSESAGDITHHMGPAQFWVLAVPFRLVSWLTNSPTSISIASSVVSLLAVLSIAWCVRRTALPSPQTWMACGFVCAAFWQATIATTASPWNPDFAFVCFVAASTICAVLAAGHATLELATLVLVFASFSAQAHLTYVLPSIALVAVAFVYLFRDVKSEGTARCLLVLTAVSIVIWIGPLIDAATNGGGNIAALLTASDGEGVGFIAGFDRFAVSLAPWKFGLRQPVDGQSFSEPAGWLGRSFALAAISALVATAAAAWRTRHLAVVALSVVVGTIASAAIAPDSLGTAVGAHVQRVWIAPCLLVWATAVAASMHLVAERSGWRPGRMKGVVYGVCAVPMAAVLFSASFHGNEAGSSDPQCSDAVRQLATELINELQDGDVYDTTAISFNRPDLAQDISSGLYAELVRRGADLQLVAEISSEMISGHHFESGSNGSPAILVLSSVPPADTSTGVVTGSCTTSSNSVTAFAWIQRPA